MPKRDRHDPNASVARAVAETTAPHDEIPADAERAWEAWSARVQRVDERTRTLLRAAFEAGVAAGRRGTR